MSPVQSNLPSAAAAADSDGVMVCLVPQDDVKDAFMGMDETTESREELHVTLWYLGSKEDAGGEMGRERLYRACYDFAIHAGYRGLTGRINGLGCFFNDDETVLIGMADIPGISTFREHLGEKMRDHGVPMREENHSFNPHLTLAYMDQPLPKFPSLPEDNPEKMVFGSIWISWGSDWQEVMLS